MSKENEIEKAVLSLYLNLKNKGVMLKETEIANIITLIMNTMFKDFEKDNISIEYVKEKTEKTVKGVKEYLKILKIELKDEEIEEIITKPTKHIIRSFKKV